MAGRGTSEETNLCLVLRQPLDFYFRLLSRSCIFKSAIPLDRLANTSWCLETSILSSWQSILPPLSLETFLKKFRKFEKILKKIQKLRLTDAIRHPQKPQNTP